MKSIFGRNHQIEQSVFGKERQSGCGFSQEAAAMLLGTQDKDFFPKDMTEKFQFIKNMGFTCFEIDGKELVENLEKVKQAIDKTGLTVSTACGGRRRLAFPIPQAL